MDLGNIIVFWVSVTLYLILFSISWVYFIEKYARVFQIR